jgi:hypothetical protein
VVHIKVERYIQPANARDEHGKGLPRHRITDNGNLGGLGALGLLTRSARSNAALALLRPE